MYKANLSFGWAVELSTYVPNAAERKALEPRAREAQQIAGIPDDVNTPGSIYEDRQIATEDVDGQDLVTLTIVRNEIKSRLEELDADLSIEEAEQHVPIPYTYDIKPPHECRHFYAVVKGAQPGDTHDDLLDKRIEVTDQSTDTKGFIFVRLSFWDTAN